MPKAITTIDKNGFLEILWIDGRGAAQALARSEAQKHSGFSRIVYDQNNFFRLSLFGTARDLILASQILKLVGARPTTIVRHKGEVIADKKALLATLACFEKSLRSKAKSYCEIPIGTTLAGVSLEFNVTAFGIRVAPEHPVSKTRRRLVCPCRLAYHCYPRPESEAEWNDSLLRSMADKHLNICPRFAPKMRRN
jgi:hypothetical protein